MENHDSLTKEEIAELRALVPVAKALREEAEYKIASRLVMRTWKSTIMGIAAVIAALVVLRDYLKAGLSSLLGN